MSVTYLSIMDEQTGTQTDSPILEFFFKHTGCL